MIDVHAPHESVHTWRDIFIHLAIVIVGILIAIGLEQTVEAIHHHQQRVQLDQDLREESNNNLRNVAHDLQFEKFEAWYDAAAAAVSTPRGGLVHATFTPLPCIPGKLADGSTRLVLPYEGVWTTARENGTAALLPPTRARIYFRRAILVADLQRYIEQLYENCPRLNAIQRRLAQRSGDGKTYNWTLTPAQAEEFAALASQEAATLQAMCFRLRYLAAFEQDLLDGGHRINGAPLDSTSTESLDPEGVSRSPVTHSASQ